MSTTSRKILLGCVALTATLIGKPVHAARLKELVEIEGLRENPLVGIGIVVGLTGTGDDASSIATRRPMAALLRHLGTNVDVNDIKAKNVALVTVTANLPAFARPGMPFDVTVSSMGSAKSLQGGTLIATPLKGADGNVYGVAQGPLALGGFAADGGSGSGTKKNHVTAGRIPSGALCERVAPGSMPQSEIILLLRRADYTTASRIAQEITRALPDTPAEVRNAGVVSVGVARRWQRGQAELIANVLALEVVPDEKGRIVIDERTGTIVVGSHVTLDPAAVAHGGITVKVSENQAVSQPLPLAKGETAVTKQSDVQVEEGDGKLVPLPGAATVGDIAAALNALGVKPRDLIGIFQGLKRAGALHCELEVM